MTEYGKKKISLKRLEQALADIKLRVYTPVGELECVCGRSKEPVPFSERFSLRYESIQKGEKWGNLFDCAWFHVTGSVPVDAKGKKTVLLLDISGEGCLYNQKGEPYRGITTVTSEFDRTYGMPGKRVVPFSDCAESGEKIDVWIDAGCNDLFGKYCDGTLVQAEIAVCREDIRGLFYDYWVLFDLLKTLPPESAAFFCVQHALDQAADRLTDFSEEETAECRKILQKQLERKSGDTGLRFSAEGHAHLDLAWLWPIRETKRKAVRTFSTALELLDRYPFYIFGASQPQQFAWVKENAPALFERIRSAVKEGRFELQGAMWVEPDLNLTSGESLVRQIVYGQAFWRENFGQEADCAHLPDVFGFTAALPQILFLCGITNLLTIKLSWNSYNKFPYHTFNWKGIDGSSVLVHMPPDGTYNGEMAPHSVWEAEKNFSEKGVAEEAFLLYGIGDGGGGPGPDHLERLKRLGSLNGLSPVFSSTERSFFQRISRHSEEFPSYEGELYLEKHQGTYTSQAKNKYYNRKVETLLRDAEYFCVAAYIFSKKPYPKEELDNIWKEVLLYQFHDILPGSSIDRVYKESVARYEKLISRLEKLVKDASSACSTGKQGVFNCLSVPVYLIEGDEKTSRKAVYGAYSGDVSERAEAALPDAEESRLENAYLRAEFDCGGRLISLFDKQRKRELLSAPSASFELYADGGDGWDMEPDYLRRSRGRFRLQSSRVFHENGRAVREQTLLYGSSCLTQRIELDSFSRELTYRNKIDWRERKTFLSCVLHPSLFTDSVNCGVQFGNFKRSLRKNTSEEQAQEEICAQRYIDLSESDYGFSVLSDCKYGYSAEKGTLRLSLLRSSEYPGENADYGEHAFDFRLYVHDGCFEESDVAECAFAFGHALVKGRYPTLFFFDYGENGRGCITECVKLSQDGNSVVIRIAEEHGKQAEIAVTPNFPWRKAYEVTPDEKTRGKKADGPISFRPFEIKTFMYLINEET